MLSGQYAHNHEVFGNHSPFGFGSFDDSNTVATALHDAGYRTGFVGKYLNNYGIDRSLVTGKHSWNYVPAGWTDWYAALQRPSRLKDRYPNGGAYDYFHTIFNVNGRTDDSHKGEYQTDVLGSFGRKLVTKYSESKEPFFLYLSALAPTTADRTSPTTSTRFVGPTAGSTSTRRRRVPTGSRDASITWYVEVPACPPKGGRARTT